MFNSKLTLTKLIITVFLTLGLSISFQSLLAQWTPPTGTPPSDNASRLLFASSTVAGRQIMEDAFEVQNFLDVFSGFSADGDTLFVDEANNRVGIGTTSPFGTLDVDGNLCISGDCISDWSGLSGGSGPALGDWDTRAENINYLATTDGIVIARGPGVAHGWGYISGYTDSSNPSTILRARNGSGYVDVGGGASITMTVKNGDYWRVTRAGNIGALTVYWIPLNGGSGGGTGGGIPAGAVVSFPFDTCPTDWIPADGDAYTNGTYTDLETAIGVMYGDGTLDKDGNTVNLDYNVPDYRGYFMRGWDDTAGNDPDAGARTDRGDTTTGDEVGTKQGDELEQHTHTHGRPGLMNGAFGATERVNEQGGVTGATGGNETRPKNINVLYCINTVEGGGSSLWTAGTGDDIYHNSGNVGIGTNNPQNKLTVQAEAAERTLYLWNNAANPELALGDGVANNHWAIYNDLTSDDLFFWKDGANRMVITDDGNVGIGTDDPGAKLEVDGTAGYESVDDMGTADTDFASKKYVDDNGGIVCGNVNGCISCSCGACWAVTNSNCGTPSCGCNTCVNRLCTPDGWSTISSFEICNYSGCP